MLSRRRGAPGARTGGVAARRGTVGTRITLLYVSAFFVSGVILLLVAFAFSSGSRTSVARPPGPAPTAGPADAQQQLAALQEQMAAENADQARRFVWGWVIALIVMVLLSLLIGRLMAGHAIAPLRLITEVTRRISADSLNERIGIRWPNDEVKDLADTIDGLLERLEASFTAQRRFVANASHELRTPLATIRASLDVAVAKPDPAASTVALAARLRTQLDRVDHLLDGLLMLARAQHSRSEQTVPVDLGELVDAALRDRSADVVAKSLTVTVGVAPRTMVRGHRPLLSRLVANLVDNAVTHNENTGWVRITGASAGDSAELIVETGGRVFDQAEVDRLTQPFERLGDERVGSSGLGLSIVSAVVTAHCGRLRLTARPDGGLRVAIALPAPSAPAPSAPASGPPAGTGRE
ncbi:sensor protein CutS [Actinoplanes italicus]|uniref:histidine kinase n=1 Tax=Actinoplanes italicus TaxID=113567 RepID=A0A2T0JXD2_9ACTN|nr:HAMP domain-containing sensor histidine kinase [Actinoplanes italicus]PRX12205.1 signal transduction histidine kinase [Actinoplanes italicus]GIE35841.1 sensor protein CutS [Actinoplanes italicus]